jgi:hypothetical protein
MCRKLYAAFMDLSDDELRSEMGRRVRRHMLISVLGVVATFALGFLVWLGMESLFHGAMPRAFVFLFVAVAFIPLVVGVASARINMRCPACDASLSFRLSKKCPGCQRDIFVIG